MPFAHARFAKPPHTQLPAGQSPFLPLSRDLSQLGLLTFDLDFHSVTAVVDTVLDLAAIDPGIIGPQLAQHQRHIRERCRVGGQGYSEPVGFVYLDPQPASHQHLSLPIPGQKGPLDPGKARHCSAVGQRPQVVDVAWDGQGAAQHAPQLRGANAHAEGSVLCGQGSKPAAARRRTQCACARGSKPRPQDQPA